MGALQTQLVQRQGLIVRKDDHAGAGQHRHHHQTPQVGVAAQRTQRVGQAAGLLGRPGHGTVARLEHQQRHEPRKEKTDRHEGEEVAELKEQLKDIYSNLKSYQCSVKENKEYFKQGLSLEKQLCILIENFIKKGCSSGTEQLIGDVANRSECRQYKILQRLK